MKLKVNITPYSSIVGGGLMLCDETGRARFLVNFIGTTEGITKAENNALAKQFAAWIVHEGLTVPDRTPPATSDPIGFGDEVKS